MSKGNSGHFKGTGGTRSQLVQELKDNKIKFSEKDTKFITKDKTEQAVWLAKFELPNHLNQIFSNDKVKYSSTLQTIDYISL